MDEQFQKDPVGTKEKLAKVKEEFNQKRYKRKVRTYRSWWLVVAVFVVIFVIISLIGALTSSRFDIYKIEVANKNSLSIREGDIIRKINCKEHSNIFLTSRRVLSKRLEKAYPRIEKVTIERKGINTLIVNITEREPIGMLAAITPETYIDRDGVIFRHDINNKRQNANIPEIIGLAGPETKLAEGQELNAKYLDNAVNIIKLATSTNDSIGIIINIKTITVDNKGNVTLELREGTIVYLGLKDNVDKMLRVKMALSVLEGEGVKPDKLEYIDARSFNLETGLGFVYKRKK